jgi:hypothetical protein
LLDLGGLLLPVLCSQRVQGVSVVERSQLALGDELLLHHWLLHDFAHSFTSLAMVLSFFYWLAQWSITSFFSRRRSSPSACDASSFRILASQSSPVEFAGETALGDTRFPWAACCADQAGAAAVTRASIKAQQTKKLAIADFPSASC